jgi:hypothetical protein
MVDGLKAVIKVSKWGTFDDAWSLQWHEIEGGALYWDRSVGAWVREIQTAEESPVQLELDLAL